MSHLTRKQLQEVKRTCSEIQRHRCAYCFLELNEHNTAIQKMDVEFFVCCNRCAAIRDNLGIRPLEFVDWVRNNLAQYIQDRDTRIERIRVQSLQYSELRRKLAESQNWRCAYCGSELDLAKKNVTLDHVIPSSVGGSNNEDNLVCACADCNSFKSNHDAETFYYFIQSYAGSRDNCARFFSKLVKKPLDFKSIFENGLKIEFVDNDGSICFRGPWWTHGIKMLEAA